MAEIFIVDRIEGRKLVVEAQNGEIIIIDKSEIETIPCEGDVLIRKDNIYVIDANKTEDRKACVKKFMKGMWDE